MVHYTGPISDGSSAASRATPTHREYPIKVMSVPSFSMCACTRRLGHWGALAWSIGKYYRCCKVHTRTISSCCIESVMRHDSGHVIRHHLLLLCLLMSDARGVLGGGPSCTLPISRMKSSDISSSVIGNSRPYDTCQGTVEVTWGVHLGEVCPNSRPDVL